MVGEAGGGGSMTVEEATMMAGEVDIEVGEVATTMGLGHET